MADESRLLILNTLFDKPQHVEEIAERLNLAPSTVSFHLKKLGDSGLVEKEKKQYYSEFKIKSEIFNSKLIDLIRFKNPEKLSQEKRVSDFNNKVLKTFIVRNKIEKLPKQLKKKIIVLEWIAEKFEFDKNYTEEELNFEIMNYHHDFCTVRRYFVDLKYFTREKNIYRRIKTETEND